MVDILIIDGSAAFAGQLKRELASSGLASEECCSLAKAMAMLHLGSYKIVLLGDDFPQGSGLPHLAAIREIPSFPEVIIISKDRNPDSAEQAIQNGAYNYLTKPLNTPSLIAQINRAVQFHAEKNSPCQPASFQREGIIGTSRLLQSCLDTAARIAASQTSVLIVGETGTGKELFARAIHKNSTRKSKPFVVVDCAALPESIAESLLFGHERGAYTSADTRSMGMVKQADGGTLFLDEVGELPLSLQKIFLRVLEGRSFRPVGSVKETTSDFRLLAATNRNLETMVDNGQFRRDLFYRLLGTRIQLPALRDMTEDINELAGHHIRRYCKRFQMDPRDFSPDFLGALMQYDWPGNIREMVHTIEQAITRTGNETTLYPRHLPKAMRARLARHTLGDDTPGPRPGDDLASKEDDLPDLKTYRNQRTAEIEKQYLTRLIKITRGDIRQSCRIAGLSRARFYALIKRHGIPRQA